jgi:D-hexose-6-phosphate mutarotase
MGGILVWVFFFKSNDEVTIIQGYSQNDLDIELELQKVTIELNQITADYDELLQDAIDFHKDLEANYDFYHTASQSQIDSSFSDYFEVRHSKVLHVPGSEDNNIGSTIDSNKRLDHSRTRTSDYQPI